MGSATVTFCFKYRFLACNLWNNKKAEKFVVKIPQSKIIYNSAPPSVFVSITGSFDLVMLLTKINLNNKLHLLCCRNVKFFDGQPTLS